jgi:hypothetical protein
VCRSEIGAQLREWEDSGFEIEGFNPKRNNNLPDEVAWEVAMGLPQLTKKMIKRAREREALQ